jgi:hypothetical protein
MITDDQVPKDDPLCDDCQRIDISMPELVFERANLKTNSEECTLCELIIKATGRVNLPDDDQIRFERDSDCFVAFGSDGSRIKILRLCCRNQGETKAASSVGF